LPVDASVSEKHTVSIVRAKVAILEEDEDSMFLRNDGIYLRFYTAPKPRRTSSSSQP
jgi:hypothetical protein